MGGILGNQNHVMGPGETPFQAESSNSALQRILQMFVNGVEQLGTLADKIASVFITTLRVDAVQMTVAANGTRGQATLASGTVTVANTSVKTGAMIILTGEGVANAGEIGQGTIVNNTSFVIQSTSATDVRVVNYIIVNPQA